MADAVAAVLVLLLLVGGATTLGIFLAPTLRDERPGLQFVAARFLLGTGTTGLLAFLLGLVRLDTWIAGGLLGAALLPILASRVQETIVASAKAMKAGLATGALPVIAVLLVLFVAAIPRPVGGIGNDAIAYHLLGPKVWLRAGRIVPVLDNARTAFPALIESLFALGMGLANERFPAMLGVVFAAVLLIQIYGFASSLGACRRDALLMTFVAGCAPALMSRAASGYIDIAYACFALAAARQLLGESFDSRSALVGGAFLGFCLGVKYPAIPLLAITIITLLIAHRRVPPRLLFSQAGLVVVMATGLGMPFYLKNLMIFGTPIYPPPPALARLLPAQHFPLEASLALAQFMSTTYHGFGRGIGNLILLPWRFTVPVLRFEGAGEIGPAPLALGLIGAVAGWRSRQVRILLLWAGLNTLVWFVTAQQSRFLLDVIALSFALAATGASWLGRELPRAGGAVVRLAAAISALYGLRMMTTVYGPQLAAAVSASAEHQLRQDRVPYIQAWDYLNNEPSVTGVLILDAVAPPYYVDKPYVLIRGPLGERPILGVKNRADAFAHLASLRVSHVLDVLRPQWAGGNSFTELGDGFRLVFSTDSARIYRVLR